MRFIQLDFMPVSLVEKLSCSSSVSSLCLKFRALPEAKKMQGYLMIFNVYDLRIIILLFESIV